MNADQLRALQAPVKQRYRDDPTSALVTLKAQGQIGAENITCKVETGKTLVEAGLHPATGGTGAFACSGDMLLEALVACAGVTLSAVATALGIHLRDAAVHAEGDLDFRGTLGVAKDAPVGFKAIRLAFSLDTDAPKDQLDKVSRDIGIGAVIFANLAAQREKDVDFDLEKVTSFEGDSGPYLQYTHARCASIMRKAGETVTSIEGIDFSLLATPTEWAVAKRLLEFPDVVVRSTLAGGLPVTLVVEDGAYFVDVTAHFGLRFDPKFAGPGWKVSFVWAKGPCAENGSKVAVGDVVRVGDVTLFLHEVHRVRGTKEDEFEAAYREGWRQPMFWLITVFGILLTWIAVVLPYFTFGDDYKMMKQIGFDIVMLAAVLFGVLGASMSISEEIEGRTAITLLSKPVKRWQFLLGKFVGILLAALSMTGFLSVFFTGVRTTGIFCRPSCPAKKPRPENVSFFQTPGEALFAGYRACKRCRPDAAPGSRCSRLPCWAPAPAVEWL